MFDKQKKDSFFRLELHLLRRSEKTDVRKSAPCCQPLRVNLGVCIFVEVFIRIFLDLWTDTYSQPETVDNNMVVPGPIQIMGITSGLAIMAVNGLIILVTFRHEKLRKPPYLYFGNLALADTLMGVAVVALNVVEGFWISYAHVCVVILCVIVLSGGISITFFVLLAKDRFIAVKYPISYRLQSNSRLVVLQVAGVWVLWLIICVVYCAVSLRTQRNFLSWGCYMSFFSPHLLLVLSSIYFYMLLIVFVMQVRIYWAARQASKAVTSLDGAEAALAARSRQKNMQLLKRLLVIWVLFFIMWTPFHATIFVWVLCPAPYPEYPDIRCGLLDHNFIIPGLIATLNSFINGLVTLFIIPVIRVELLRLLPCCRNSRCARTTYAA